MHFGCYQFFFFFGSCYFFSSSSFRVKNTVSHESSREASLTLILPTTRPSLFISVCLSASSYLSNDFDYFFLSFLSLSLFLYLLTFSSLCKFCSSCKSLLSNFSCAFIPQIIISYICFVFIFLMSKQ
jgi:hypothetical protein